MIRTLFAPLLAAALLAGPATAGEPFHLSFTQGDLTVEKPWIRPNLPNRPTAGYVLIANGGTEADRLIGATSPSFETIELHTMEMSDGVMKMQRVEGIELPAGESVALAPGGYHLMMFGAEGALKPRQLVELVLTFERAGELRMRAAVSKDGPALIHSDDVKESGHSHGHGHTSHGTD